MEASVIGGIVIGGFIAWQMYKANQPTLNEQLVCPHCQKRGTVMVGRVRRNKGISGGKATGAVLTGGLSAAATGLSRHEMAQHMTCTNCRTGWDVA